MLEIIADPDFKDFDGSYVDNKAALPPTNYDLSKLAKYMKDHSKSFEDFSEDELDRFKL